MINGLVEGRRTARGKLIREPPKSPIVERYVPVNVLLVIPNTVRNVELLQTNLNTRSCATVVSAANQYSMRKLRFTRNTSKYPF